MNLYLNGEAIKSGLRNADLVQRNLVGAIGPNVKSVNKRLNKNGKCTRSEAESISKIILGDESGWKKFTLDHETPKQSPPTRRSGETNSDVTFNDLWFASPTIIEELHRPGPPRTLYVAISEGDFIAPILTSPANASGATEANIKDIHVVIMRDSLYCQLTRFGAIDAGLFRALKANLEKLRAVARNRGGKLKIRRWRSLPPVWGILIGDFLIFGEWTTDQDGRLFASRKAHVLRREGDYPDLFEMWAARVRGEPPRAAPNRAKKGASKRRRAIK